jgi:hypothetical protein
VQAQLLQQNECKDQSVKGGLRYKKLIEVPACELQTGVKFMSRERRIK